MSGPAEILQALLDAGTLPASDGPWEIAPLADGVAFTTSVYRISSDRHNLIAKVPAGGDRQAAFAALEIYQREVDFYRLFSTSIPLPVPTYYGSLSTPGGPILLIDEIVGREPVDQIKGVSLLDAEKIVRDLATFHAWSADPGVIDAAAAVLPAWSMNSDPAARFDRLINEWEFLQQFIPQAAHSGLAAVLELGPTRFAELAASASLGNVVIHGDCRADNLMTDGSTFTFLDFQFVAIGPPLFDLAYFVSQSVAPSPTADDHQALLSYYLETAVTHGAEPIPWDSAWLAYRGALLVAATVPIVSMQSWQGSSDRGRNLLLTIAQRAGDAVSGVLTRG